MENKTANRVIDLPYVGVVLLVFDDGVETISTVAKVDFIEVLHAAKRGASLALCRK